MTLYAATIFLSAFLLFQIQPLIAKIILPWFGGSAAVWSAAMLFFQLILLAGYAYAHLLIRHLKAKPQMAVHIALLAVSCALLPILPSPSWKPQQAGDPTIRILETLLFTIGLPYFLLSATSPLLQAWYVRRSGSGVPYRLFALSNFGSMLALVSFPFVVEPRLTSREQAFTWSGVYVLFALVCAFAAWRSRGEGPGAASPAAADVLTPAERPSAAQLLLWIALAACASTLLVAVTNHMSQNLAPIPLLWVLPLAIYLLTFILAFESDRIYRRWIFLPFLVPTLGGMTYYIWADSGNLHIKWLIPGFALGLFICCMMCHGELARRRPAPQYLTLFYLMVSIGGAVGGIFVALVAPRLFTTYLELPVGLSACALLAVVVLWSLRAPKIGAWPLRVVFVIAAGILIGFLIRKEHTDREGYRFIGRNFYGVLRVHDDAPEGEYRERTLTHGTINHGSQLLDPKLRYLPTSYYGLNSGVGRAITAIQAAGPARLGIIGLGAGVLSNYGREGDVVRIYDINPLVERIAQTEFSFYPHSQADKHIYLGDARLELERQESQQLDLLAVDAFSSDAIPIHLLTHEALALYFRHLKPGGILALHVSNRYLDLVPVCASGAKAFGKQATVVDDDGEEFSYLSSSTWVLVTADMSWFDSPSFRQADMTPGTASAKFRAWTDDYSNIFQILKLN
jgi:hypothetical protein